MTQKEIAQIAGVSPSTVSMVMRGRGNISGAIRKKVLDLAETHGYSPQPKSLRDREQNFPVYIMVLEWESFEYQWNFIKPFMVNLSEALIKDRFFPVFYHLEGELNIDVIEQAVIDSKCAGICSIHYFNRELFARLERRGIVVILLNNNVFQKDYSAVCVDDFQGVYNGVSYLVEKGHTNILYYDYKRPDLEACVTDRYYGFKKAAEEHDIRVNNRERITLLLEDKDRLCREFHHSLEKNGETTAIFFHDDYLAAWAIPEMERMGIRIPQDISVIAPGDTLNFNEPFIPQFTTIQIDTATMGKLASGLIEEQIENPGAERKHLKVTPAIIERGSCKTL